MLRLFSTLLVVFVLFKEGFSSSNPSDSAKAIKDSLGDLPFFLAKVDSYSKFLPDDRTFFVGVFGNWKDKIFIDFDPVYKLALLIRMVQVSKNQLDWFNQVNYSDLTDDIAVSMAALAVKESNFQLFKKLVAKRRFSLNKNDYCFNGYTGNAIVLVAQREAFFNFAVEKGLDLSQPIIDSKGNQLSASAYCEICGINIPENR